MPRDGADFQKPATLLPDDDRQVLRQIYRARTVDLGEASSSGPDHVQMEVVMHVRSSVAVRHPEYHFNARPVAGQREVYVTPFPGGGTSQMVSRGGGTEPRWSRSGRELFFKSGGQLVSVPVTPGPVPAFGAPRPLFAVAGYRGARNRQQYDVAPGDQRFLMIRNLASDAATEAVYVENWFTELQAKLKQ